MTKIILISFAASLLINLMMFVIAFLRQTDTLTDISYAVSFGAVALAALVMGERSATSLLTLLLVAAWAVRIGSFLLRRIRRIKIDHRFDGMRESFWKFLRFWVLQAITVGVVMLPVVLASSGIEGGLPILTMVGALIAVLALTVETLADNQKQRFMQNSHNKDKWIDVGLWRATRHPNYLGEITFWVGIYLASAPLLAGWALFVGVAGPLFIASMIIFVSGIPLLEKSADARWKSQAAYRSYKRTVPVLVPTVSSILRIWRKGGDATER